jgi:plasmid stabilization system protein ParE
MVFRIVPTLPAVEDTEEIVDYIQSDSAEAAAKWLEGLWDMIESLRTMPLRFAVIPESLILNTPYRSCLYHSHRIIYRVDETEKVVYIVRIYHVARTPLQPVDFD